MAEGAAEGKESPGPEKSSHTEEEEEEETLLTCQQISNPTLASARWACLVHRLSGPCLTNLLQGGGSGGTGCVTSGAVGADASRWCQGEFAPT